MVDFEGTPGNCYEDCFILQQFHAEFADAVLAHGYPRLTAGPTKGRKYGHAWLEKDGLCYDHLHLGSPVPAPLFYAIGRIDPDECTRYTPDEAAITALETGIYGAWNEAPADAVFANEVQ